MLLYVTKQKYFLFS